MRSLLGTCNAVLRLTGFDQRPVEGLERFGKKRMIAGAAFDPARGLPQKRKCSFRACNEVVDALKIFSDF